MQQTHHDKILDVDGYEVSASFADTVNTDAITHVKQILISSFVSRTPSRGFIGTVAIAPEQRDNSSGGKPHVP